MGHVNWVVGAVGVGVAEEVGQLLGTVRNVLVQAMLLRLKGGLGVCIAVADNDERGHLLVVEQEIVLETRACHEGKVGFTLRWGLTL